MKVVATATSVRCAGWVTEAAAESRPVQNPRENSSPQRRGDHSFTITQARLCRIRDGGCMAIIGRSVLLALTMLVAGCAGLDPHTGAAGDYPDEVYGRGGWNTERDLDWRAHDPYYSPYGWNGFGPYGYWGYPGWWGPPVYYVYPHRDVSAAQPERLRPLQERMLYIAPLPLPRSTRPPPTRPLPSWDRGVFPPERSDKPGPGSDGRFWLRSASPPEARPFPPRDRGAFPPERADQPGSVPDRLPRSRPASPPAVKPLPVPAPPVVRPPPMSAPEPQATPSPRPRRLWRRPGAGEE